MANVGQKCMFHPELRDRIMKSIRHTTLGILAENDAAYNAPGPVSVAHKMRIKYTLYNMEGKCQDQVPGDSKTESHYKFIINKLARTRRSEIHRLFRSNRKPSCR